jgi:AraC-like DNA-binding protein
MDLAHTERLRFTFNGSGLAVYPPGATFGPRTLRDFEFVWIIAGNVEWEVDGHVVPAPPGTVILARPGQRDGFRWDPRQRTRHGYFHFSLHQEGGVLPPQATWPLSRLLPPDDILRPLFHHLGWLLSRSEASAREQAQGVLRQALVAYLSGLLGTSSEADAHRHPLVERVLGQVQERWAAGDPEPFTLGDLARLAGVSKVHLTRVFHAQLGMAPVAAIRQLRLDRAVTLLARTNLAVQEIAESTGFPNAFHFSKVFRQHVGQAPRDYRRAVLAGQSPVTTPLVRTRGWGERW